jgi:hypothetical protein
MDDAIVVPDYDESSSSARPLSDDAASLDAASKPTVTILGQRILTSQRSCRAAAVGVLIITVLVVVAAALAGGGSSSGATSSAPAAAVQSTAPTAGGVCKCETAGTEGVYILGCCTCTGWCNATLTRLNSLDWRDASTLTVGGKLSDTATAWGRLPAAAEGVVQPSAVWGLSQHSAGLSVSFETNAESVGVRYDPLPGGMADMWHMPATGVSGADLYAYDDGNSTWRWVGTVKGGAARSMTQCQRVFSFKSALRPAGLRGTVRYKLHLPTVRARGGVGVKRPARVDPYNIIWFPWRFCLGARRGA